MSPAGGVSGGKAVWPPPEPRPSAGAMAGEFVLAAVELVGRQQLSTGEIPVFERVGDAGRFYWPAPLFWTLAHDALGTFDRDSILLEPAVYDLTPVASRQWLANRVAAMRWRLRGAVAFHEEADGSWCSNGRGSGQPPDPATTACAASVLLESQGHGGAERRCRGRRHIEALGRLGDPGGAGFGDRLADAHALRFLAAVDGDVDGLADRVLEMAGRAVLEPGATEATAATAATALLAFAHAAARAWKQAGLPRRDELAELLAPAILAQEEDGGGFGSAQRNALAAVALLDLGFSGSALGRAAEAILSGLKEAPPVEVYLLPTVGSPAFVLALAASAVARAALVLGWSRE